MQQLLKQLFEEVKKEKKQVVALKNLAVELKEMELAAMIRDYEVKNFPEGEINHIHEVYVPRPGFEKIIEESAFAKNNLYKIQGIVKIICRDHIPDAGKIV